MPLIFRKQLDNSTELAVWERIEEDQFFISSLQMTKQEEKDLENMRSHRQKEWLTSRYLLNIICPSECRLLIQKDTMGKPTLEHNTYNISISHSRNHIAVIKSNKLVGIDIQHEEEKIVRIQHKFISEREHSMIDPNHLLSSYHIFWGAKECMYKAYGKREIEFRDHMHLYPFKYYQTQLELSGWLRKSETDQNYNIYTDKLDHYYLSYAILDQ